MANIARCPALLDKENGIRTQPPVGQTVSQGEALVQKNDRNPQDKQAKNDNEAKKVNRKKMTRTLATADSGEQDKGVAKEHQQFRVGGFWVSRRV